MLGLDQLQQVASNHGHKSELNDGHITLFSNYVNTITGEAGEVSEKIYTAQQLLNALGY